MADDDDVRTAAEAFVEETQVDGSIADLVDTLEGEVVGDRLQWVITPMPAIPISDVLHQWLVQQEADGEIQTGSVSANLCTLDYTCTQVTEEEGGKLWRMTYRSKI